MILKFELRFYVFLNVTSKNVKTSRCWIFRELRRAVVGREWYRPKQNVGESL